MLPRDDVIDLKWRAIKRLRHPAILAESASSFPYFSFQLSVHVSVGRAAGEFKGFSRLRLHQGKQMANVAITFQFDSFFARERPLESFRPAHSSERGRTLQNRYLRYICAASGTKLLISGSINRARMAASLLRLTGCELMDITAAYELRALRQV